ncbi:triacylglycerol lipase NDAI_0C05430 [Naumovozyma dairenensis CBS 421]|uniref:AB hydrolase-1 domain-containing protein n=1 Tax=Naumovozyma dairenensis (strain ATCC 10597 / BCRC 20456 / CBS 421 / NBRC 0211 / NRRL Y-12639) TaxID=1071378 RepID=G0W8U1_NAUDC|nr:hypothetical protein NDAI_0C05430 [Naumovozyma dairenensis CBS 421]CCD24202.1 hypothetical protein NDAI_0C05430 [Naumovozyma dairenensis CBS 421]
MNQGQEELIVKACSLEGEPLSKRTIETIASSYVDDSTLAKVIVSPESMLDFSTKFIHKYSSFEKVDGKSIRVCRNFGTSDSEGDGNHNEPLYLFIHGLGGVLEQFEPLLRLLDLNENKFLALDLPGFGKSDEYEDYNMFDVISIIHTIVDRLIPERTTSNIVLVGHSMGCYISLHLFYKSYTRFSFKKLVFLSPPKPQLDQLEKTNRKMQWLLRGILSLPWLFDFYRQWFDQSKGLSSSGIKRFFYHDNEEQDHILKYRKLWQFHNNVQIKSRSILGYLLGWEPINWEDIRELLLEKSENTEIVVLTGMEDPVTPLDKVRLYFSSFGDVVHKRLIEIPECSHNLCFDLPLKVCELFLVERCQ